MTLELRPAQERALKFSEGKLAISAVPGAGKTFILTQLAVRMIRELGVLPRQILILTYMRGAASTFKRRIAGALAEHGLSAFGLQAMTIHAFCLSVIKRHAAMGTSEDIAGEPLIVLSEIEQRQCLAEGLSVYLQDPAAMANWKSRYRSDWDKYDPVDATLRVAQRAVSSAKHHHLAPDAVDALLAPTHPELSFLYRHYLELQRLKGLVDYDDQIQNAIVLLREHPDLLAWYQGRYRFVLEDEAQDSTPAQHELITLLTDRTWGGAGNLVRVGDSNQSITTTFTFNDPRYFRDFCASLEASHRHVRMDESSRSAPEVLALANALVEFVALHPDPAIASTFMTLPIQVATAGKQNPEALEAPDWTMYPNPDAERDAVLLAARDFLRERPESSAAVLLFRREDCENYARQAIKMGIPVFEGEAPTVSTGPVLEVMEILLGILAEPAQDHRGGFRKLVAAWLALHEEAWDDSDSVSAFLATQALEGLTYPEFGLPPTRPLRLSERDYGSLLNGASLLRQLFEGRWLSPEELLPRMAEAFFRDARAPMIAAKAVSVARRSDRPATGNPWRDLLVSLHELALHSGRKELIDAGPSMARPAPGELQVLTMHRSKGAEYEAVWLPALGFTSSRKDAEGQWHKTSNFPWHHTQVRAGEIDHLRAESILKRRDSSAVPPGPVLEREAQNEVVSERLRLLYVGITRAERALHLSASPPRNPNELAPNHLLYLSTLCRIKEASPS